MPTSITREEVQQLVRDEMAQLLEVLPSSEYQDEHIQGAVNLPLKNLDRESASQFDQDLPIIVYWHDAAWDMSPRAAWRLEAIGFNKVYDYVGGKADWFAAGLPREGLLADVPRAGDAARQDDVTCRIDDRAGDIVERLRAAAIDIGIVTTDGGVVLGRVRGRDLVGDHAKSLEETMESGPTTIRADTTLESIIDRLEDRSVSSILVTHSDGRLVGSLYLSDAQSRLDEYELRQTEAPVNEGERCCMCKGAWGLWLTNPYIQIVN